VAVSLLLIGVRRSVSLAATQSGNPIFPILSHLHFNGEDLVSIVIRFTKILKPECRTFIAA